MNPFDLLLRREKHVLHTPLSLDECCRCLPDGFPKDHTPEFASPRPLVSYWIGPNDAGIDLAKHDGRRLAPRVMRAHFTHDGAGTIVEVTTELAKSQLVAGVVLAVVFGAIAIANASVELSHGNRLLPALWPWGFISILSLVTVLRMMRRQPRQDAALLDTLGGVLGATLIDGRPTMTVAPSSPVAAEPLTTELLARAPAPGPMTLFTPFSVDQCMERIGPNSRDAGSEGGGVGGMGLTAVWRDRDEVELSKSGPLRGPFRHILRVRFSARPNGAIMETEELTSLPSGRFALAVAAVIGALALLAASAGGRFAVLNPFPIVLIGAVAFPIAFLRSQRTSARQHAFLRETLQNLLAAAPTTNPPDTGVR